MKDTEDYKCPQLAVRTQLKLQLHRLILFTLHLDEYSMEPTDDLFRQ